MAIGNEKDACRMMCSSQAARALAISMGTRKLHAMRLNGIFNVSSLTLCDEGKDNTKATNQTVSNSLAL